jgi:hypothetical protein
LNIGGVWQFRVAVQSGTGWMSALPPKADIRWAHCDVRFVPKADILRCKKMLLFDHLVGDGEQRRRDGEAQRPGGVEVDD